MDGEDDAAQQASRQVRRKANEALELAKKMITIHVGSGQNIQSHDIYEHLLVKHSDFFHAALRPGWQEAANRTVDLPEESAESFELVLHFVSTGHIFSEEEGDYHRNRGDVDIVNKHVDKEWTRLCNVWLLGQVLQSTAFKDAVTDTFRSKIVVDRRWPLALQKDVYASSSARSGLRRLLVAVAAEHWSARTLKATELDQPVEFYYELLLALKSGNAAAVGVQPGPCAYHEHVPGNGMACYLTMF